MSKARFTKITLMCVSMRAKNIFLLLQFQLAKSTNYFKINNSLKKAEI